MGFMDYFKLNRHLYKYSIKQINAYQETEVLKIVGFAKENSEYYKKNYPVKNISCFDDFYKLPEINKQVLMDNFDGINTCGLKLAEVKEYAVEKELNSDFLGYYKDKYVIGLSSGTSGNKGIYITPKSITKRLPFVFLARSGISLKLLPFRILFLLRVFSQGFEDINSPIVKLKYMSTMTPINEILLEINNSKTNILMGPPSLIRLLLPYKDRITRSIKLIVCYAEVLEAEEKKRFARMFKSNVIEIYQASEGQIGSTCKHGNLHINEDLVLVELFDREGHSVSKPGIVATKMLVTNLVNYAQPLIRYEMNDLVVLGERCSCGSHFRVIEKIIGRHDDVLYFTTLNDNRQHIFPDLMSRWIITASDNIREFKVLQFEDSSIEIIVDLFVYGENEKAKVLNELMQRMNDKLLEFEIKAEITITFRQININENIGKFKRFNRINL